jgi:hypothetical protein
LVCIILFPFPERNCSLHGAICATFGVGVRGIIDRPAREQLGAKPLCVNLFLRGQKAPIESGGDRNIIMQTKVYAAGATRDFAPGLSASHPIFGSSGILPVAVRPVVTAS